MERSPPDESAPIAVAPTVRDARPVSHCFSGYDCASGSCLNSVCQQEALPRRLELSQRISSTIFPCDFPCWFRSIASLA